MWYYIASNTNGKEPPMHRNDTDFRPLYEQPGDTHHPIRPSDITSFTGTFGKFEVEESAERIVKFFKERGRWCAFTLDELARFYTHHGWDPEGMFFGLLGGWFNDGGFGGEWDVPQYTYFAFEKGGGCMVTDRFVTQCARNVRRRVA
jgi:hypothetical protein